MLSKEELAKIGIHPDYRDENYQRISWDEYFMNVVEQLRKRSHDAQTQHACLAVRDNIIIGSGVNGYPPGSDDMVLPNLRKDGKKYWIINHSEENLIYMAAKIGVKLEGCKLYISGRPCWACARKLITVGIKEWIIGNIGHQETEEEYLRYKYLVEYHNVSIKSYLIN